MDNWLVIIRDNRDNREFITIVSDKMQLGALTRALEPTRVYDLINVSILENIEVYNDTIKMINDVNKPKNLRR